MNTHFYCQAYCFFYQTTYQAKFKQSYVNLRLLKYNFLIVSRSSSLKATTATWNWSLTWCLTCPLTSPERPTWTTTSPLCAESSIPLASSSSQKRKSVSLATTRGEVHVSTLSKHLAISSCQCPLFHQQSADDGFSKCKLKYKFTRLNYFQEMTMKQNRLKNVNISWGYVWLEIESAFVRNVIFQPSIYIFKK